MRDLVGKNVEYHDPQRGLRTEKVVSINGEKIRTVDGAGSEHDVERSWVQGIYRKGYGVVPIDL